MSTCFKMTSSELNHRNRHRFLKKEEKKYSHLQRLLSSINESVTDQNEWKPTALMTGGESDGLPYSSGLLQGKR